MSSHEPSDTVRIDVLGLRACLTGEVLGQAALLWAPFRVDEPENPSGAGVAAPAEEVVFEITRSALCVDGEPRLSDASVGRVLAALAEDLNRRAVTGCQHYAVHAGVVRVGDRTIAWPAPSGAGKSTLTAACLQAGAAYVSDEALCVDYEDALVQPYPKPIALDGGSLALLGLPELEPGLDERLITAAGLGARLANRPAPLTDLVRLDRRAGGPAVLDEVPRTQAVPLLLEMSFNHYKRPADSIELVARLARGVRMWRLGYADPNEAAAVLAQLPES